MERSYSDIGATPDFERLIKNAEFDISEQVRLIQDQLQIISKLQQQNDKKSTEISRLEESISELNAEAEALYKQFKQNGEITTSLKRATTLLDHHEEHLQKERERACCLKSDLRASNHEVLQRFSQKWKEYRDRYECFPLARKAKLVNERAKESDCEVNDLIDQLKEMKLRITNAKQSNEQKTEHWRLVKDFICNIAKVKHNTNMNLQSIKEQAAILDSTSKNILTAEEKLQQNQSKQNKSTHTEYQMEERPPMTQCLVPPLPVSVKFKGSDQNQSITRQQNDDCRWSSTDKPSLIVAPATPKYFSSQSKASVSAASSKDIIVSKEAASEQFIDKAKNVHTVEATKSEFDIGSSRSTKTPIPLFIRSPLVRNATRAKTNVQSIPEKTDVMPTIVEHNKTPTTFSSNIFRTMQSSDSSERMTSRCKIPRIETPNVPKVVSDINEDISTTNTLKLVSSVAAKTNQVQSSFTSGCSLFVQSDNNQSGDSSTADEKNNPNLLQSSTSEHSREAENLDSTEEHNLQLQGDDLMTSFANGEPVDDSGIRFVQMPPDDLRLSDMKRYREGFYLKSPEKLPLGLSPTSHAEKIKQLNQSPAGGFVFSSRPMFQSSTVNANEKESGDGLFNVSVSTENETSIFGGERPLFSFGGKEENVSALNQDIPKGKSPGGFFTQFGGFQETSNHNWAPFGLNSGDDASQSSSSGFSLNVGNTLSSPVTPSTFSLF